MTNIKTYDSEFCGKVPLHQTNLIQPHGVLMIVQYEDLKIIQVSENVQELLAKPATAVAETSLKDYITIEQANVISERINSNTNGKIPFTFTFSGTGAKQDFLALVQAQKDYLIIEIEKEAVELLDRVLVITLVLIAMIVLVI